MKSIVIMMGCWLVAAGCARDADVQIEEVTRFVQVATDGGRGGAGGSVTVLFAESREDPESETFSAAFSLAGGAGGEAGVCELGPQGSRGDDGPDGELESSREADYQFDAAGIDPDMVIDIGENSTLYIHDTADPLPVLRLDTFRVRDGAEMEIGCDVRIQARHFVIEEGGRLTIRSREGMNCSIGVGRSLDGVAGLDGPLVYIQAELIQLDGILDMAGNPDEPGKDGGDGGHLILRTRRIELGSRARVLVNGGAGGVGVDERELSANSA